MAVTFNPTNSGGIADNNSLGRDFLQYLTNLTNQSSAFDQALNAKNISASGDQAIRQIDATGQNTLRDIITQGGIDLNKIGATGAQTRLNQQDQGNVTAGLDVLQGDISGKLQGQKIGGEYGVANIQKASAEDVANIAANAGISEAQIGNMAPLMKAGIDLDKYNLFRPYAQDILSQISPMLKNVGSMFPGAGGGGPGGYAPPGASTYGGQTMPFSNNTPNQVISPGQAQALIGMNTNQGNAGVLNNVNSIRSQDIASGAGPNSPLSLQLSNQLAAANRAGLQNAATSFQGTLAPANAQQALGAGQLGELQRSNTANEALKFGENQNARLTGLGNILSGFGSGLNLGGT